MTDLVLILAWLAPLLMVVGVFYDRSGRWMFLAAVPALAASLWLPSGALVEVPWLLLGVVLGLDSQGAIFLFVAALLWLVAASYCHLWMSEKPNYTRFRLFFLLAMAGNFGVILSQDLISFYLSFSVMGLSAYGLIVHQAEAVHCRAGRVYLIMTLLAELAIFVAFVRIFQQSGTVAISDLDGSAFGNLEIGLLIVGFGIKAGVFGLHFWLPLAHPAAPIPASAVLSGAMIKTALVGWIRLLPFGENLLMEWGGLLVVLGIMSALLAIVAGVVQRDAKVVLAYSSIGKMGLMVAVLGIAAMNPDIAEILILAVVIFSAHHGLAKGALFLAVGLSKYAPIRNASLILALPAVAFVGLPFTSGAIAKQVLEAPLSAMTDHWSQLVAGLLILMAVATPLLVARFFYLLDPARAGDRLSSAGFSNWWPWLVLSAVILLFPLYVVPIYGRADFNLINLLLVATGIALAVLVWFFAPTRATAQVGRIPPGDCLYPIIHFCQLIVLGSLRLMDFSEQLKGKISDKLSSVYRHRLTFYPVAKNSLTVSGFCWIATALCLMTLPMVYR